MCVWAVSRNASGHNSSAGSGQSAAHMTARQAASGRRAHQMCKVEMCPCRMLFSRRAWAEMRLIGKSTSISRLQYLYILGLRLQNLICSYMVVFHLHNRFPPHTYRVLDHVHLGL